MDIKVFGRNQTMNHSYIYSFDTVETKTRISHSKILEKADTKHVMEVIDKTKFFIKILE